LFEIVKLNGGREAAMVLYARFTGARLKLTAAKLETVWVERKYSDITWHYAKPKKIEKGAKVEIAHIWHVTAAYAETSRDCSWKEGAPVWGGRWEPAHSIVADDGIREIHDACRALNPADAARERRVFAA
jgi:hypothetical protein